ncbi:MAG: glycosyltransferase family 2 protein, partial [Deltaproteobacteria bacterium]|nr:glycosyltransferase family 2 protein [Deltaproteobacteria bacterium]
MFHGKKIVVVMPAYNAAKTIERTYREIPMDLVDEVVVTDDASPDDTVEVSKQLGLHTLVHHRNRGYGGNQKTCYTEALRLGADVTVMLHPDYQYTPALLPAIIAMITDGPFDAVLGSRVLGGRALAGGMPMYKYIANRGLTAVQNILCGAKLSEYHTGYRAFSKQILESLPLLENSDDFVFDNQMLAQILLAGFEIGEVSCPAAYFEEASSINFQRSVKYGL